MRAAVRGAQHRAAGPAGPRHPAIHRVDAAQPRRCDRGLPLPGAIFLRWTGNDNHHDGAQKRENPGHLHCPQYKAAAPIADEIESEDAEEPAWANQSECQRSLSRFSRVAKRGQEPMKTIRFIAGLAGIAMLGARAPPLAAQQPIAEHFVARRAAPVAQQTLMARFMAHNTAMGALQPSLITPLVAPDPRLVQYAKLSFSNQYTPAGTQTVNYGNARGGGIIAFHRFEFDGIPPPYIQHNGSAKDGFGDMSVMGKVRLASGNAEHGNFVVAAMLSHTFALGSHKNGAPTDAFLPTLVAGKAFKKHYDIINSLGGVMPQAKSPHKGARLPGTNSCKCMPRPTCGSKQRIMPLFILAVRTTARCRTSLRRRSSTWCGAKTGSQPIHSSSSTRACRWQPPASIPTITTGSPSSAFSLNPPLIETTAARERAAPLPSPLPLPRKWGSRPESLDTFPG